MRHCLNCISDQIQEYLSQLNRESMDRTRGAISFLESDVACLKSALLESNDIIQQFGDGYGDRSFRFAVETQCLPRDMGNTLQLLFSKNGDVPCFIIQRGVIAKQIEEIGDCRKRIINFMRDDTRNSPHRSKLFSLSQSFFSLRLGGDVAVHFQNRVSFMVHCLVARNNDFCTVSGSLKKVAQPGLPIA